MPAFYSARLPEFLTLSDSEITGLLSLAYANVGFTAQKTTQTLTWVTDIAHLRNTLGDVLQTTSPAKDWTVVLEFEIPRKEKRIDVVLLAGSEIVVLELKSSSNIASIQQAEDYALLLHYFHRPSYQRRITTFVVSPHCSEISENRQQFLPLREAAAFWVSPVELISWDRLSSSLRAIAAHSTGSSIDSEDWLGGEYRPVPTIIDAARSLEAGLSVREIAHSQAARHNVDELTDVVDHLVETAKRNREHIICFITGVPGAGKTLVGLNLAFARSESREPIHFMSGTGPLVNVLQAVLAKNKQQRDGTRMPEAIRAAKTLIENVHIFAREYSERDRDRPPSNHVVIFDEAQRAWNREQNKRKFKRDYSEPEMILRIMKRHKDWAVIIALVGGGQEINSGEAGLTSWGEALLHTAHLPWKIYAPPQAFEGSAAVAGAKLFIDEERPANFQLDSRLHLNVSVRSLRAEAYSAWVNHVIEGDAEQAAALATTLEFPIVITRSLREARALLRENTRGESRCGLVASSNATRIRAEGLEPDSNFHGAYPWDRWYLAPPKDTRSSYQLEVFATEFEIQGLELDWIGLCWGGDFIWDEKMTRWRKRSFSVISSKWSDLKDDHRRLYRENAYRVLLTRARQGIVIFIPKGDAEDPTQSPFEFDQTAAFLERCGARFAQVVLKVKAAQTALFS